MLFGRKDLCILLCLCKPLRTLVGVLFWILLFVVVWQWPSSAAGRARGHRP